MENPVDDTEPAFRSLAFDDLPVPDFADVIVVPIPAGTGPIHPDPAVWAGHLFSPSAAPGWVKALFALRQAVVGLIGISRPDRSIFAVDRVVGPEALISVDDRHLDFRCGVGVDAERRLLRVTTAVRLHGWRGRLYFAPVSVLHPLVTRSMASRAAARPPTPQPPTTG